MPQPPAQRTTASPTLNSLPPLLRLFLAGSLLLFLVAWAAEWVSTHLLRLPPFPYGIPTLPPNQDFLDITIFWERFLHFHTAAFFDRTVFGEQFLYPAPAALIYRPYYLLFGPHADAICWFEPLVLLLASALFFVALRRRGLATRPVLLFVAVSYLCSWPFFFEWKRANIEIFLFLTCALGLLALLHHRPCLAVILFGAAAALKFYPALLLGLLLGRRQTKAVLLGLASMLTVTFISLWFVGPTISLAASGVVSGLRAFGEIYVSQRRLTEIGFDHSLVALVKSLPATLPPSATISRGVSLYIAVTGLVGATVFLTWIRHLPFLNQLLCLAVACTLLPPTSYDYTLLMLYLPWSLLILTLVDRHQRALAPSPGLLLVVICFTIVFGYQPEFIHHGVRFGSQIKAVALTVLLGCSVLTRIPSTYDLELAPVPAPDSPGDPSPATQPHGPKCPS